MAGIVSYGAHIPFYRLDRREIARAWGTAAQQGEKAVANYDEDAITMGVSAALDCIKGLDRDKIAGLYFASTTSPYREKSAATTIATAIDLRDEILVADFAHSLRAGMSALEAALNAVNAKSAQQVLVVASECRLGAPKSDLEMSLGDGAAALLIGESDVSAEIEGTHAFCDEILDFWRQQDDPFVKSWEMRFVIEKGYMKNMQRVVSEILKKYSLTPKDFAKVVLYAPDARSQRTVTQRLGFDAAQIQDSLFATVGNTGTAYTPMILVAALQEANPGDRILVASCGDGASAYTFRVTDHIKAVNNVKERCGVSGNLLWKKPLPSYETYLSFRKLIPLEPSYRPGFVMSASRVWRDREGILRFYGTKCNKCGTVHFPPSRICVNCQSKDDYEKVRLTDKGARLYSFSLDHLGEWPTVNAAIDFEGGGRIFALLTDCDPSEIKADMPLEMTLRLSYQGMPKGREFWNYNWKARPAREKL
jgi:3-hydroxy-3-methylglutaryl CoA synthase/uncharacterized OB-fold protein